MNKKMIAMAAAVVAAAASVSSANAQGLNFFKKESKGSEDALGAVAVEVAACKGHKEAKKRPGLTVPGLGREISLPRFGELPPLCVVETPLGILVIAAEMLDEATINASLALDMAQNVLLPENERIRLGIAQMLETRDGLDPKSAVSRERDETGQSLGKSADEIVAALEKMRVDGAPLKPEVRKALTEASALLTKATYYQAETMVGLALLKEAMADTEARALLKGAGLEFAQRLPDRAASMFTNFPKLSTVQNAIAAVGDKSMVSDMEKAKKKAADEGEENARKQAENSDAAARTVNF